MKRIGHFVDGKAFDGEGARTGEVFDPATGTTQAEVAFASSREVDEAVASARAAADDWGRVPVTKRAGLLFAFRDLVDRYREDIARVVTAEHGKVHADALGEVQRGLEVVEFACGTPHLMKGEFSEGVASGVDAYSLRQPLGVVAGITPFNFPVMVPMWMFPVAVACGNAFVLKPSEKDPSAAIFLAELFTEAGLPPGVFNVVQGDKEAVDRLLEHPHVAAISSVGSTPVARHIYETSARFGKRVQALGGAKNHMVVMPDADMDMAADAAVSAAYGSTGQRCMAISALVAVGDAADVLLDRIRERTERLVVGPGSDPEAEMGPLVTGLQRDKVAALVDTGIAEGADLAVDGRSVEVDADGFFLGPCMFDRVSPEMSIYKEEIFGPVLVMLRAERFEDALALVNSNPYGNGTAIFTADGGVARRFRSEVEVGMVGINVPIPVPMAFYSFGGWKDSLFGDAHVHGTHGIDFYTRAKAVTARWPESKEGVSLNFPR